MTAILISHVILTSALLAVVVLAGYRLWRRLLILEAASSRLGVDLLGDRQALEHRLDELATRLDALAIAQQAGQFPSASPRLQFDWKSRALEHLRCGNSADEAARALGVPLNQVKLLEKIAAPQGIPSVRGAPLL